MGNNKKDILLMKNFSGGFNDEGIGHEIINSFDRNNNETDYTYFYVPPYGSVGKEDRIFYTQPLYRNIKVILVFDSTNITNILKLKSVVVDPVPFNSFDEMFECAKNAKYGPNNKALTEIDFKDKDFLKAIESEDDDEEEEESNNDLYVFPITYKVNKSKYYNLERYNLFIWHSRNEKCDALKDKSKRELRLAYGDSVCLKELGETRLGQKNYSYNLGDDLYSWFNETIKPLLCDDNIVTLQSASEPTEVSYSYNKNNIMAFLKKLNDENIYTNFISAILNSNKELLNRFMSFLVKRLFNINNYSPSNSHVEIQVQSLIEEKKIINSYLDNVKKNKTKARDRAKNKLIKKYNYTEEMFADLKPSFDGQMDLYCYDDNYRIVLENKILSGLNGKHKDVDYQITQLDTYRTYIDDLNSHHLEKNKVNKVALLVPNHLINHFVNYKIEYGNPKVEHRVPVMTYSDLADFFTENQELILEEYRHHFLNVLYKQSLERKEEILNRFLEALA